MQWNIFSLTAVAVVASATLASATTITQQAVQPQTVTDWSEDFTFNNFNPSLGTLRSVTATLSDGWTTFGTVTNTATNRQTFNIVETTSISVAGGPSQLNVLTSNFASPSVRYVNVASGATAVFGSFSSTDTRTYSSVPADLAAFQNPGTFDINLSTLSGESIIGGGGNISAPLTTTANATFTLVYTYDETPGGGTVVPEPASVTLVATGLLGLAGFVSRRSSLASRRERNQVKIARPS